MKPVVLAAAAILVLVPASIKIARVQTTDYRSTAPVAMKPAPQPDGENGLLPSETTQQQMTPAEPAQFTNLQSADSWRQGQETQIHFESTENLASVSLYIRGKRTPVGGRSRGEFVEVISKPQPLKLEADTGVRSLTMSYTVSWFDSASLELIAKGFDAQGKVAVKKMRSISFVPKGVPKDLSEGVVVSKTDQRLYRVKDGRVARAFLVSTGRTHSDGGGPTPSMTTHIRNKSLSAYSRKYDVDMRYWNAITSDGRYGIHATYSNLYRKLGRADSHGCVRLHLADAKVFYKDAPVGTPVYVVN
ncbi:MAG: L,D-transpeptidase [Armatimonadetes bacterium]|nr:L,D-transpeptidase [Armatimonadota bacterium]